MSEQQQSSLQQDINISQNTPQKHQYLKSLIQRFKEKVSSQEGAKKILLYGCNGYTAGIILNLMRDLDFPVNSCVFSARNPASLTESLVSNLGENYGKVQVDVFPVDEESVNKVFKKHDISVALNCAGPFEETAQPFVQQCAAHGVSYLDITGEVSVFESVLQNPDLKKKVGNQEIVLIPGVGFDILVSENLLKSTAEAFENKYSEKPNKLEIMIVAAGDEKGAAISHGTKKTMLRGFTSGGSVTRLDGKLQAPKQYVKDFKMKLKQDSPKLDTIKGSSIPWGDISAAYFSTNVPNIHTYMPHIYSSETVANVVNSSVVSSTVRLLFSLPFVLRFSEWCIQRFTPRGPTKEAREKSRGCMLAVATNKDGSKVVRKHLYIPEGYKLTAECALACALKVALGECDAYGPTTPSLAFGSDFITKFDNCSYSEEEYV